MLSSCKKTSHVRIRSIPRLLTLRSSFVGRAFNGRTVPFNMPRVEFRYEIVCRKVSSYPALPFYSFSRVLNFFPWRFIPIMHCQNPHLHSRALCNESLRFLTYALDSIAFSRIGYIHICSVNKTLRCRSEEATHSRWN